MEEANRTTISLDELEGMFSGLQEDMPTLMARFNTEVVPSLKEIHGLAPRTFKNYEANGFKLREGTSRNWLAAFLRFLQDDEEVIVSDVVKLDQLLKSLEGKAKPVQRSNSKQAKVLLRKDLENFNRNLTTSEEENKHLLKIRKKQSGYFRVVSKLDKDGIVYFLEEPLRISEQEESTWIFSEQHGLRFGAIVCSTTTSNIMFSYPSDNDILGAFFMSIKFGVESGGSFFPVQTAGLHDFQKTNLQTLGIFRIPNDDVAVATWKKSLSQTNGDRTKLEESEFVNWVTRDDDQFDVYSSKSALC